MNPESIYANVSNRFGRVFEFMELAEEQIPKVAQLYPHRKDAINKAFKILAPTMNMTQLDERVYLHHVHELLHRVGKGELEGAELGTTAEVLIVVMEATPSARRPPGTPKRFTSGCSCKSSRTARSTSSTAPTSPTPALRSSGSPKCAARPVPRSARRSSRRRLPAFRHRSCRRPRERSFRHTAA